MGVGNRVYLIKNGIVQDGHSLIRGNLNSTDGNNDSITTTYVENNARIFTFVSDAARVNTIASWTFSPSTPEIAGKKLHYIGYRKYMMPSNEWVCVIISKKNNSPKTVEGAYGSDRIGMYPNNNLSENASDIIQSGYKYISFVVQKWGQKNGTKPELVIKDLWLE